MTWLDIAAIAGIPLRGARVDLSETIYQKDPWAERANAAAMQAFAPLADLTREAAE